MTDAQKDNAHDIYVGIEEIISDLQPAPPQMVADVRALKDYQELSSLYDHITPLIEIHDDIIPNTAGTVAAELKEIDTNKTVSLACFDTQDAMKKPIISEPSKLCTLVLGTNSPNGDCYVIDNSLADAITLFSQNCMIDEKDDTIHVIFSQFDKTVRKIAENREVKILTTEDKKYNLMKLLKGANIRLYSTIRSAFIDLEQGNSLDDALADSNVIHLQELAIEHDNGFIESHEGGLYFVTYDEDGNVKLKTFICSPLKVLARCRDMYSNSWGMLLEWYDRDKIRHRNTMPDELLQGDSREYRKLLASQGFTISEKPKAQKALDAYLIHHPTENRAECVDKVGWHDDAYVLPDKTYNSGNQLIVYQPDKPSEIIYRQKGSLEQWRNSLSKPLAEQSRIAFAICCAFAGQLLDLVGAESGGFHIVGGSSMGKSIGLKVAGSVWGNPDNYIKRWRVTDNGLESVAAAHNDSFLGLDEISEGDPKVVGNSAYMLANGQGKVRSKAGGGNRPTITWRLMFLSNGEKTLDTYLKTAGLEANAGQMVRLIHIEADAGTGHRSFDSLVIADTAEEQANLIKQLSTENYGVAGIAWLEHITSDKQAAIDTAKEFINHFMQDYKSVKKQAHRVAQRFAIVAAAGEMATQANITGWKVGQATKAVKKCLDNWLENYGSEGEHEENQIIKQVQSFIEQHGSSRFQQWPKGSILTDYEPKVINRIGWRKPDSNLYLFYRNSFNEVCGSFEVKKVLQVLDKAGLLEVNEKERHAYKIALPDSNKTNHSKKDQRTRMYAVTGDILNYDKTDGTDRTCGTGYINQEFDSDPLSNQPMGQMGPNNNLSHVSPKNENIGAGLSPVNISLSHVSPVSQSNNYI